MVSVPTVEGRCDIHASVHKGRVEGDDERKVPQRNIAKGECQCERIESSRRESGNDQRGDEKTIAMDEWEKERGYGEESCGKQQHAPWPQQPSQVDGERADKHQRRIEGTVEPGTVVKAYANVPLQIGETETEHSAGKSNEPGASDHSQDTEKRTRRYF